MGQAPRVDITPDILPLFGEDIQLIEKGALDNITPKEIEEIQPDEGDYVLVSRMKDGSQVRFAERKILPRIQRAIDELEAEGAACILMFCTGKFPAVFKSNVLLLYPFDLLQAVVPVLAGGRNIAVFIPDESQVKQCRERWMEVDPDVRVVAASPYKGCEGVKEAAKALKDWDGGLIIMDCMGYSLEMKHSVRTVINKPVILPRTLLARTVIEYL